jgi:pilus assembly protein CpaE
VVDSYPDLDQEYLSSLLASGSGGVKLLAAPSRPELADLVAPEHVKALLEMLRGIFRHIVVDLGAHLDDPSLEAVQAADQIILVTDLDLPTIKNAQLALKLFDRLGIPADRVFVVLNRSDARTPVLPDQVEQHLLHPVAAQIPTENAYVQESVRRATPLVRLHPDADLSRAVLDLVAQIGCTSEGG